MMSDRRREGRTSRTPVRRRRLSRRVLIVCGGKETEKQYFQGLRAAERNPAVRVVIRTNPRSPTEVVRYADKLKRQAPDEFEDVWCVFDVDEFHDVGGAAALARTREIGVAISNPCFELWLLLHFACHTAHCPSYGTLLPLLRRHVPGYDKAGLDFDRYAAFVADACARARALDPTGRKHAANPSTGVWQVVELVRRPGEPA